MILEISSRVAVWSWTLASAAAGVSGKAHQNDSFDVHGGIQ